MGVSRFGEVGELKQMQIQVEVRDEEENEEMKERKVGDERWKNEKGRARKEEPR